MVRNPIVLSSPIFPHFSPPHVHGHSLFLFALRRFLFGVRELVPHDFELTSPYLISRVQISLSFVFSILEEGIVEKRTASVVGSSLPLLSHEVHLSLSLWVQPE